MPKLGVNIDHVATLRQARRTYEPDPVFAAHEALLGGAEGITIHLREDRRHIQDRDLRLLRAVIAGPAKLNLEMALSEEILALALQVRPDQVTLVPEKRQEVTTEGGLDCRAVMPALQAALPRFREAGIPVSLFIDPDPQQINLAADLGVEAIELHTGRYAEARGSREIDAEFMALQQAVTLGRQRGLIVHAGHGLNYLNVPRLAAVAGFEEFNIGHAIVARAVFVGLRAAVREMHQLCRGQ